MTSSSYIKFTIGIPVFNGQKTLGETLESCKNLPCEMVNIIISDNNSTDETYEIAKTYTNKYSNFNLYKHETNLGPTHNFNFLLKNCKTEFFMWLAADDIISETLDFSEIERLMNQYPDAIGVSPYALVEDLGRCVVDSGNQTLVGPRLINILRYLLKPGVNSRFYSIYRTERLRALHGSIFEPNEPDYFGSDIVFSVGVLHEGVWPMATNFILNRKAGISADGWKIRKIFSKNLLSALIPSAKFVKKIVGMCSTVDKIPVLLVASMLYIRYLIGPAKHKLRTFIHKIFTIKFKH
jgi:glycosyltransferase involved in cell wall biosynthesis